MKVVFTAWSLVIVIGLVAMFAVVLSGR